MKTLLLLSLLACLCTSAFAQAPAPEAEEARQTLIDLEHRWAEAELRRDTTAMSALLSEDFRATTFYGLLVTDKAWALRSVLDPKLRLDGIEQEELDVRLYGDLAVVTGRALMDWGYDGKDFSGAYRYTRVYRNEAGAWRIIAVHVSRESEV